MISFPQSKNEAEIFRNNLIRKYRKVNRLTNHGLQWMLVIARPTEPDCSAKEIVIEHDMWRIFNAAKMLLLVSLPLLAVDTSSADAFEIVDIQSRLFYEQSATFSEDVLGGTPVVLWNTFAGGGDAAEPSTSALALAVVRGLPPKHRANVSVIFMAYEAPSQLHPGEVQSGPVAKVEVEINKATHVPLWIPDTTCQPIRLRAVIRGSPRSAIEETMQFECGE
jgi:hypothetical protein